MQKELQELVQLRAEAAELQLARRTSAASEQSLQAHVGSLEVQLHDCQAQLQQAQQQLGELMPRLAASTKCVPAACTLLAPVLLVAPRWIATRVHGSGMPCVSACTVCRPPRLQGWLKSCSTAAHTTLGTGAIHLHP